MLWIVGTARCGKKSLCYELGGTFEPQPWIDREIIDYYLGDTSQRELIEGVLEERRDLDTACVADWHQSLVIPDICRVDPKAKFIWLLREPFSFCASMSIGNNWHPDNQAGRQRLDFLDTARPAWNEPVRLSAVYYEKVNKILSRGLPRPLDMRLTHTLTHKLNAHPDSPNVRFTPQESAFIASTCWPFWQLYSANLLDS